MYLLAATETKRCYVTIKHFNLNFPEQCNLKVYSRWLWIFLSSKSPEEWENTKQACRDESVVFFLLPIFISRSTLTYRALYYGKIETQTSQISCLYFLIYEKWPFALGSKIEEKMHKHCTISVLKETTLNVLITEN